MYLLGLLDSRSESLLLAGSVLQAVLPLTVLKQSLLSKASGSRAAAVATSMLLPRLMTTPVVDMAAGGGSGGGCADVNGD